MPETPDEAARTRSTSPGISGVRLLAWVVFFALALALWTTYDYYRTGFFETRYYAVAFAVLVGLALFTLFIAFRRPAEAAGTISTPASGQAQESPAARTSSYAVEEPSRPTEMVRRIHTHPTSRGAVVRMEYELGGMKATDYRIESGQQRWDLDVLESKLDNIYLPVTRTPDASDGAEAAQTLRTLGGEREAIE